ncbi:MAG: hypothetical protein SNH28_08575, partial [Rikenellaceae bacterium]
LLAIVAALLPTFAWAQIALIGDNTPHKNVNDGDFSANPRAYWRLGVQPPFWSMRSGKANKTAVDGDPTMGLHNSTMFGADNLTIADSKPLNTNPEWQSPKAGEVLKWEIAANLEYRSDSYIEMAFVFGDTERTLLDKTSLVGSDKIYEVFSGEYTLTRDDAKAGAPFVRIKMHCFDAIKIFVDYVNVSVASDVKSPPSLTAEPRSGEIALSWSDKRATNGDKFFVYRQEDPRWNFNKIGESTSLEFIDRGAVSGKPYTYVVTRVSADGKESGASQRVTTAHKENIAPAAPSSITAQASDSEVRISWSKSTERDVASYSIWRDTLQIATGVTKLLFDDILAPKGVTNTYTVYAHDFSGNRSVASQPITAKVDLAPGASFSDLIQPMPITTPLTSATWGGDNVLPRDINNGIESPDWTYWGGRPVLDPHDSKYHILVTRWSEKALKGHWEWPRSTVAHAMSDNPIGPYRVVKDTAYDYANGLGHNPDIILMPDGSYALYSLIDWKPTILTAPTMSGEWKRLGEIKYDLSGADPEDKRTYQYERNLSGVVRDDGSIVMVSKFGAMMVSHDGLLGPYKVVTSVIQKNPTLPKRFRKSGFEDPVMWRDSVQYHLIINAFIDKRAVYFRSRDGINWVYDAGLAYTDDFLTYTNGVVNKWYKLERPHILQDSHGRATHLSLAVIDSRKEDDYGDDNHNSKNLIVPLTRQTLLKVLPQSSKGRYEVEIISEEGFDATQEIDIESLRYGAPSEVNYGRGGKAVATRKSGNNIIVTFEGANNAISEEDFVLKLLGRKRSGELIIGYTKLL